MSTPDALSEKKQYLLRGQAPLDALSLVRIPLAVVVLVVVTGVLAVAGLRLESAIGITSKLGDELVAVVAFGIAFFAARRAAALVRSKPRSLVVVSASEVRYAIPKGGEHRFPNEGIELVSRGVGTLVFRHGGQQHELPIDGELVGATGSEAAAFHRLGVHDGRLVVTRVLPGPNGADAEILPLD